MKLKWDTVNNRLMKGKRAIKKTDLDSFAQYAIWRVENGESITTIFTEETDEIPRLAEVLFYIDENYTEAFAKANSSRLAILKEDLLQATSEYKQRGSKDNLDKVVALEKLYSSLSKHNEATRPFNLVFNQIFPDDFWGETCPIAPENPRVNAGE